MNDLEFSRLLLRLKKAKTDSEKAALYRDLREEAAALSDYHRQRDPNYAAPTTPLKFETDGTF
jgi:hypothetical protein